MFNVSHVRDEQAKYDHVYTNDPAYGGSKVRLKLITDKTLPFGKAWQSQVMPNCQSSLDIGTGVGRVQLYMRERHIDAKGIDISQVAIDKINPVLKNHVQLAEAGELPFPAQSFDIVYHFDGLEHIHPDRIDVCIKEHARVSRRYLAYTVPDDLSNHDQDGKAASKSPDGPTGGHGYLHLTVMSLEEWSRWFTAQADALGLKFVVHDARRKFHKVRRKQVGQLAVLLERQR